MEYLLLEVIFRGIIVQTLGVYSRYYFFRLIGSKKSISYLTGSKNSSGSMSASQDFFNALVGLIVFCAVAVLIAYIVFS